MTFFGITDPYIIGAYVGCILCTALCIWWALFRKDEKDDEEGEE